MIYISHLEFLLHITQLVRHVPNDMKHAYNEIGGCHCYTWKDFYEINDRLLKTPKQWCHLWELIQLKEKLNNKATVLKWSRYMGIKTIGILFLINKYSVYCIAQSSLWAVEESGDKMSKGKLLTRYLLAFLMLFYSLVDIIVACTKVSRRPTAL